MSTNHCVVEITDSKKFDFILSNYQNKLIVVDFTATWCGPCQRIKPYFHECSNLYKDKCLCLSVDVDKFPELTKKYNVEAMPTFLCFLNQKKVHEIVGMDKQGLQKVFLQYSM